MSITLTYNGTTLDISERLLWTDEYDWSPVEQVSSYSTTGALLIDVAVKQVGRPITLDGRISTRLERAVCDQLYAWKAIPGAVFILTVRAVARQVMWLEFEAAPVWRLNDSEHQPTTVYRPYFKFIEI